MIDSEILDILIKGGKWKGVDYHVNQRHILFSSPDINKISIRNYSKVGDESIEGSFTLNGDVLAIKTTDGIRIFYLNLEPTPNDTSGEWYRFNLSKTKEDKPDYFSANVGK